MKRIAKEWLVLLYDTPANKRLDFRPAHLKKLPELVKSGFVTSAGPFFKDNGVDFAGSMYTIEAESKEAVMDVLQRDVYAKEKVWDLNNVVIHPFLPVVRKTKDLPKN